MRLYLLSAKSSVYFQGRGGYRYLLEVNRSRRDLPEISTRLL